MELLKTLEPALCDFAAPESTRSRVERYFVQHYSSVLRYLVFSGSPKADAEDILQETFLRLYGELLKGKTPNNLRNWLFRVSYNLRIDRVRLGAPELLLGEMEWLSCVERVADASLNIEATMLADERKGRLAQAMAGLTARQSQYLLLRAEGLTYREIAELHGIAIGTVAEACGRAMEKLSRCVRD